MKRETLLLRSISNRASDETLTLLQTSRGCGVVQPMKGRLDRMLGMGLGKHSLDLRLLSPMPRASLTVETKGSCIRV